MARIDEYDCVKAMTDSEENGKVQVMVHLNLNALDLKLGLSEQSQHNNGNGDERSVADEAIEPFRSLNQTGDFYFGRSHCDENALIRLVM